MKNEKNFELAHRLKRAQEFEGGGKMLHAIQMYQAIIDDFFDDHTAWYKLVEIYEKMGRSDSAIKLIEEMLEHFSNDNEISLFAGHFFFKHQMWEESVSVLDRMEDMSFDTITYFIHGLSSFHLGNHEQAIKSLQHFLEMELESAFLGDTNLYLARCYITIGKLNVALPYLEMAAQLMPTNPEVYHYLALYYSIIGMHSHAAEQIETSISLGSTMRETWELAAGIYEAMKDTARVEKLCRGYIEGNNEPSVIIYNSLAMALLAKNRYKEAGSFLKASLEIDSTNERTNNFLKMLITKRDDDLVKDI